MTKEDVCNLALGYVGEDALISNYDTDTGTWADLCTLHYPIAAQAVLVAHPWSEAIQWATLESETETEYTSHATNNTTGDTTIEVQESIGDIVPQSGTVTIADDEYEYTSWTGSIFTLASGESLTSDYDDDDSVTVTPNNRNDQYEYMYDLPSDCLKVLELENDDTIEFLVEGDYLYCNEWDDDYGIRVRYIKDIRDEVSSAVVYNDMIADAIARRLAYRFAQTPGPSKGNVVVAQMAAQAREALLEAIEYDQSGLNGNRSGDAFWSSYG